MLPRINRLVGYAREREERRSQRARWQNNDHRKASREHITHVCVHYLRERERGGEKEGEREEETGRERERNTVGHATRHTSLTNSITWPLTRRSRKTASNVWLRTCTSIQSDWKRTNDIFTESILEILTLSVRRRFYVKNRIWKFISHIYT